MQFRLPWSRTATPRPPTARTYHLDAAGTDWPVVIARHPRARRYVLRFTADGQLRLTVPRGSSIAAGLRFAASQSAWIAREQDRRAARQAPWVDGHIVRWRGAEVALRVRSDRIGIGPVRILIGEEECPVPARGETLRVAFEAWARGVAGRELPSRTAGLAASCGERVTRIRVGNQRSRWGSCSPRGAIALNWRLLQTPPFVSDYVIVHELMHLRHANHSRRFWREVEKEYPRWREAERWLRKHGRQIMGQ